VTRTLALALLFASLSFGEHRKLAKLSRIAIVAASTADAASSWGGFEANPLLRSSNGRFGVRGSAIKFGVLAAWLLATRKHKYEPVVVYGNFAAAGALSGVAVRNWRIR
jgi:hypothetical protein